MIPSAEFEIILSYNKGHSARPEALYQRALLASMISLDKCTTSAKAAHAESSRYGAKFDVLCKSLQYDVPVRGFEHHTAGGEPGHAEA